MSYLRQTRLGEDLPCGIYFYLLQGKNACFFVNWIYCGTTLLVFNRANPFVRYQTS